MAIPRSVAVFDLGGVLIDWNPRHLYRKLFEHETDMEHFLANICTPEWNQQLDAGRSFAEACAALKTQHANRAEVIDAWFERFDEMMAGPIAGTVDILSELREREVPLYALSNWSAETFPFARRRFEFLQWFRAILLSGEVHLLKPDPRIFERFCEAFALRPEQLVYIDDAQKNVEAARRTGMHGISNLDRARGFYARWFHAASTPEYSSARREFRSRFLSLD